MAKGNNKKSSVIERNKAQYSDSLKNIIKILGIVLVMFIIIYIGTAIARGELKLKKEEKKSEEVTIQTEEILAGSTFNITNNEYMVLYYDFSLKNAGVYGTIFSSYKNSGNSVKMYRVDLSKGFNKSYVTDGKVNSNPTSADNLKVKTPTLIRIKNKKVTKVISTKEGIKTYINSLL